MSLRHRYISQVGSIAFAIMSVVALTYLGIMISWGLAFGLPWILAYFYFIWICPAHQLSMGIKKCKPHSNSKFRPHGKVTLGKVHMHRIIFQHVFDTRDTHTSGKLTISEGDKLGDRFS